MMNMDGKNYKDLEVWKEGRKLVKVIYDVTNEFPESEKYALVSQVKRASVSIVSNIAEGTGRNTHKDTLQFLYISKGSVYELETQLYLAFDLGFISNNMLANALERLSKVRKLLIGLIKYKKELISVSV